MPQDTEPSNPREAYKAIIDQFVLETHGPGERLVRESGIYTKLDGQTAANGLVQSMTAEQRRVLAGMLHEERVSAIASVLSVLTWWIACREVGLTFRGQPMPFELTEEGLHGDFLGRCNGWKWLDGDEP